MPPHARRRLVRSLCEFSHGGEGARAIPRRVSAGGSTGHASNGADGGVDRRINGEDGTRRTTSQGASMPWQAMVGCDGIRRARGRRGPTHAGGQPECVAHNNQQTMVVEGGGRRRRYGLRTSASATTRHDMTRGDRNIPGAREERTGGDEEEEGREGRDGTTIDAERGTSDGDVDNNKKEGATMMEGRREEEGRAVAKQQ